MTGIIENGTELYAALLPNELNVRETAFEKKTLNNILIQFTNKNITEIRWQLLFVPFETNEFCDIHVKYMLGNMKMFSYCYKKGVRVLQL